MTGFSKLEWQKQLRGAGLSAGEFQVLIMVATYTDERGRHAFPSVDRLGRDCGMQPRSVQRILRHLEGKGWLVVEAPGGHQHGHGTATTYALGTPSTRVTVESPLLSTRVTVEAQKGDPGAQGRVTLESPHQISSSDQRSGGRWRKRPAAAPPTSLNSSNSCRVPGHDGYLARNCPACKHDRAGIGRTP